MAKSKNKMVKRSPVKRRRAKQAPATAEGNDRVVGHTNMVIDPCNSKITPTAYRGQDGFVQRFARTNFFTTTTETCFMYVFYPAYNSMYLTSIALPSSGIAPITYNIAGPGQTFLLANSDAQRPIAACAEVDYTGTELNRQGMLYMGSVKASIFSNNVTVDQITALIGHPRRVPDSTTSVKWIPSPVDEEYWPTGAAVPEAPGDRNVIVVIGTGFTSPVSFQFTTTLITEWQPNQGLGIAANTPNTADAPAGMERVRTNLSRAGNWWISAAHTVESGYQTAKAVYNATRGVRQGLAMLTAA